MTKNTFKSGFVAVIGKPNVGKSSLVNALVGEKVSITSPKPETTRNKILGIKNGEGYQVVFVDTPGMLNPRSAFEEYIDISIKKGVDGVDALLIVLDAERISNKDFDIIKKFETYNVPIFVAVNKLDITSFEHLYPKLAELNAIKYITELINVSAKTGKNIDMLFDSILKVIPVGTPMYDTDSYTDRTERFMVGEIVREKALIFLQQEVPHGIAIDISRFSSTDNGYEIDADIVCEKANHKQIIIGKGGEMLKKIGSSARTEIEKLLGAHVYLKLFVKVEDNWRNDKNQLKNMGYDTKNVD